MHDVEQLIAGLDFAEALRWHDGQLFFSDVARGLVCTVDLDGQRAVLLEHTNWVCGLGWLPDGRLLVVNMRESAVLRREHDGSWVTHADLSSISNTPYNDMVVATDG